MPAFASSATARVRRGPRQGVGIRICVTSRERMHRELLLRVVRLARPSNASSPTVHVGKGDGRAAYVSARVEAVQAARRKNRLAKALRAAVPSSIYDELEMLAGKRELICGMGYADAFGLDGPEMPVSEVTRPIGLEEDAIWE